MRSLVSILTLTALLLHLLLGCEWLHAHAESHGIVANEAHDHQGQSPDGEHAPAEEDADCHGCDCVFDVSSASSSDPNAYLPGTAFVETLLFIIATDPGYRRIDPSPPALAAVRPHLLLQVILI